MNRDTRTTAAFASLLAPAAALTATTGTGYVDLQGADAVEVIVAHGAVTADAGANNFVITLQHADENPAATGSYATVPASDLNGSFELLQNGVAAGVQAVGYRGPRRYLRAVLTETGTAQVIASVSARLGLLGAQPETFVPATGAVS